MPRVSMARTQAHRAWPRRPHHAGSVREALRQVEQERRQRDAAAVAEAVSRPTMRFVQIKRTDQVDTQALHRARDRMVAARTRLISQMRAFCLEYGIPLRLGAGIF